MIPIIRVRAKPNFLKDFFCILLIIASLFLFLSVVDVSVNNGISYVISLYSKPKIFCMIISTKSNYLTKVKTVYNSWAYKCDYSMFIMQIPDNVSLALNLTLDNQTINDGIEVNYNSINILQPPNLTKDVYIKLTDKIFNTFKYVYNKYNNYDWYLKTDDDTFVFVDNLRDFLSSKNKSDPITFGYDFNIFVEHGYHSGGAGYLLSNEALKRIGSKLNQNLNYCNNSGIEDVDVAKCLRSLGVYPNKSIDYLGRERFHPLSIKAHIYQNMSLEKLKIFNIGRDYIDAYGKNPVKYVSRIQTANK